MARGLVLQGSRQAISREAAGAGLLGGPTAGPPGAAAPAGGPAES